MESIIENIRHSKKFINDSEAINKVYQDDICLVKQLIENYKETKTED